MHILFITSPYITLLDIPWALLELKHNVEILHTDFSYFDWVETKSNEELSFKLRTAKYDFVISYNFLPVVSNICNFNQTKYVAWIFDCPSMSLHSKAVTNSCNYIFAFDKIQYQWLVKNHVPHVYHLPLAANISRTGAIDITLEDEQNYSCDISFVGQLYCDNIMHSLGSQFSPSLKLQLTHICTTNAGLWNQNPLDTFLNPEAVEEICHLLDHLPERSYIMDDRYFTSMYGLSRILAEQDRLQILSSLSQKHNIRLYSNSITAQLPSVVRCPPVRYEDEMVKVFYLSKVNLNISLRSIQSGVPLRVFDVLGSGGFLISNTQPEISQLFEPNRDLVLFSSLEELHEQVAYYLAHPEERLRIAMNGYKKVCNYHTYVQRLQTILDVI